MSYVYGEAAIQPTATITSSSTTTGITITGSIGSNVGTYVLTYNATDSLGYKAIPQIATIFITPKPVTVTANVATKVYGTANPSFTYASVVGLVGNDKLTGSLGSNGVNVGSYDITSTLSNNNYAITFIGVSKFIISKKAITITANPATKVYGTANPSFTYASVVGLVGSDSLSGGLSVSVSNNADAGTYDITSTLSHNNYDITFIGANKFSITKASQSAFSAGNNQKATTNTTFTIITTGASSTNPATYSTSNANIATIDANGVITLKAAGTVTIGATSTADNNYNAVYDSFILTIYPSTTTLADATATSSGIQLAWSAVVGASISYKVYYASETIINFADLATNYSNLEGGALIDNITTTATTVPNFKHNVVYHFVVTVAQNNIESVISNEVTSTLLTPIQLLNDTGLTWAGNYPSGNNSTCESSITAPQDCHQGRDASNTLVKVGAGSAGFDFTKLDSNGDALPTSAASWSCVKDNHTGLIWEVKTATSSIHYATNTYRWGGIGADSFGSERYTDWNTLVNGSNADNLCGFNNWRVPNRKQLKSIVDYSRINPSIDTDYFPNTPASYFWSSSAYANDSSTAWYVDFNIGDDPFVLRSSLGRVRLVRPGQ